jgi:hypothetical protein
MANAFLAGAITDLGRSVGGKLVLDVERAGPPAARSTFLPVNYCAACGASVCAAAAHFSAQLAMSQLAKI